MKRIRSTMVESGVLFPVASVSSLEENVTSVVFSCSGVCCLIHQPMPPRSPSSGGSILNRSCRSEMERLGLQADRRVTVDDKSSVNTLTGFSLVLMAPIQGSGAASSSDVVETEPLPTAAEAGRVSQEVVPNKQGQPLRVVETDAVS